MAKIVTSAQMRALEAAEIESGRVTGLDLMERAGRGVLAAILDTWPGLGPGRAVILCGPGNNGGDGHVIARLLAVRGWDVAVHEFGDPARLPPDAAANRARAATLGLIAQTPPDFDGADLVVDALFGIGLTRPLQGYDALFETLRTTKARIVAVDLPSGMAADSATDWPAAPCDLCVTFHAEKPVHQILRDRGVRVVVQDIGLPQ